MTLHWWMHWFWVTAQLAVILASPLPSTTEAPKEQVFLVNATQNLTIEVAGTTIDPRIVIDRAEETEKPSEREETEVSTRASFRVAKAIGSYGPPARTNVASASRPLLAEGQEAQQVSGAPLIGETSQRVFSSSSSSSSTASPQEASDRSWSGNVVRTRTSPSNMITRQEGPNVTGDVVPAVKRDSRITWVLTTGRPPVRRRTEEETITEEDIIRNYSSVGQEEEKDLTVLPLRVEATRFKLVVNRTRTITANGADGFSTRTFNGSEDIEIDQELAEPRLAATAASILQGGISDSTRLSRAQNTFTRDFQRDQEQEEIDRSSEIDVGDGIREGAGINAEIESSTPSAVDIAAITGSCLATVVLLSTMASLGFVMYRRKYLNPPQTLNSDKCSNPDSSGYIDDSTIRDNSEEMYSLDNDSFLNSLEAMTIQNYWTDSVKHTKL